MSEDLLRYDRMVERALRGVVRETLEQVAEQKALPGDHHFYITFITTDEGVQLPEHLKKQYPEEMTIVLQYQFYDLAVDDENLSVTLSFNNKLERLVIPLNSITTFADPAVSFALQFQSMASEDGEEEDDDQHPPQPNGPTVKTASGSAEIVTLDAFRKKQQEK